MLHLEQPRVWCPSLVDIVGALPQSGQGGNWFMVFEYSVVELVESGFDKWLEKS